MNSLSRQSPSPTRLASDLEEYFKIERIIGGDLTYLIKWKNYAKKHKSWILEKIIFVPKKIKVITSKVKAGYVTPDESVGEDFGVASANVFVNK